MCPPFGDGGAATGDVVTEVGTVAVDIFLGDQATFRVTRVVRLASASAPIKGGVQIL